MERQSARVESEFTGMVRMNRTLLGFGFAVLGFAVSAQGVFARPAVSEEEAVQACSVDAIKGVTMPADRMPQIPFDKMTPDQKKAAIDGFSVREADDFHKASTTNTPVVTPPYAVLLRSPEVLLHMKRLNVYLQDHSSLPMKLRQFVVMITARQWSVQYTYAVHCPQAVQAGISPETARAIGEGRRPVGMAEDEQLVYDFLDELDRTHSVSDETYARALEKFGEQGIVDMVSLHGWYTFFLMNANVARIPWRNDKTGKPATSLPVFPH